MMPFHFWIRVKNMTRETKLGLVVSCSFLCLLGAVLALKLTEPPEDEQGPEVAAAAPNEGAPPPPNKSPDQESPQRPPHEQEGTPPLLPTDVDAGAKVIQIKATVPEATPPSPPSPPVSIPTLPPVKADPPGKGGQGNGKQKGPTDSGNDTQPGTHPTIAGEKSKLPPLAPPAGQAGSQGPSRLTRDAALSVWASVWGAPTKSAAVGGGKPSEQKDLSGGRFGKVTASGGDGLPPIAPPAGGGSTLDIPPPPALPPVSPTPGAAVASKPAPPAPAGTKPAAAGTMMAVKDDSHNNDGGLPTLPAAPGTDGNKPRVSPPAAPPAPGPVTASNGGGTGDTTRVRPVPVTDQLPAPPPVPEVKPTLAPAPGEKKDATVKAIPGTSSAEPPPAPPVRPGELPPPPPVAAVKPPLPPPAASPTIDIGRIGAGSTPAKGQESIVVGGVPSARVPPLSVPPSAAPAAPARAAPPDVISYVEETYVANAGDTFASLSKAKYETDKYARALYLFNRSHPLAGDELLQDDRLTARQKVYVPPVEILESRYPGAIGEATAATKPGVTVGAGTQRANAPPAGPRTYRVGAGGEKVYDIARRLLGDGNRWVEIDKLNPGWKPELAIPEGTALKVPDDAHLPQ
jgi:hypothetical protein